MTRYGLVLDLDDGRRLTVPIEVDGTGDPWRLAVMVIRIMGPIRGASMRNGQGDEVMGYDPVTGWYSRKPMGAR